MGSSCAKLYDSHIKTEELSCRSNDIRIPKYDQPPLVEYSDLLVDAKGVIPRARQYHSLVMLRSHQLLCYGGICATIDTDDPAIDALPRKSPGLAAQPSVYSVLDNTWRPLIDPRGEPPIQPRALHTSVVAGGKVVVFGNHEKSDPNIHYLDRNCGSWETVSNATGKSPGSLLGHSATTVGEHLVAFFGGENAHGVSNDLHLLDVTSNHWTRVPHLALSEAGIAKDLGRRDHTAVVFGQRLLVYGGVSPSCDALAFLQFDAETSTWSRVREIQLPEGGPVPPARKGHSCVMHQHYMLVFGGVRRSVYLNDLWVFDVYAGLWSAVSMSHQPAPLQRAFPGSCTDGLFWYIHGGGNSTCFFRSLLRFDLNEIVRSIDETFVVPDSRWSEKRCGIEENIQLRRRLEILQTRYGERGTQLLQSLLAGRGDDVPTREQSQLLWERLLSRAC